MCPQEAHVELRQANSCVRVSLILKCALWKFKNDKPYKAFIQPSVIAGNNEKSSDISAALKSLTQVILASARVFLFLFTQAAKFA